LLLMMAVARIATNPTQGMTRRPERARRRSASGAFCSASVSAREPTSVTSSQRPHLQKVPIAA
jgi:hypothetical protein